jgi:TetR/AcrR family transcriptional regulator, multidrug resistance operon repressor
MRARDEQKEEAIREEALKMIAEEGFDGLSMQKLAKAAGVSPATIYIYYKDRDDLIVQLWVHEMDKMIEATLHEFDPDAPFAEGLRVQWMNRAHYSMENPVAAEFLERVKHSRYENVSIDKVDPRFLESMQRFVHNGIRRKEIVKLPMEIYWSVAFAPLYNLVRMHKTGRGLGGRQPFTLDDKMLEQTLKLVIKALTP